ncbi:MAG: flippase-like domain-containing protein [Magnetococcales bacterium]|nr:flippase-like domain-containing protein [Magnetococcales bacterium]
MANKAFSLLLRVALVGGCVAFLFNDLDLNGLWAAFRTYNPWLLGLIGALVPMAFLPPALRLVFLSDRQLPFKTAYAGFLLGMGMNNIFPAKLGELFKISYYKQKSAIPISRGMGMVFWERFFDLNALLTIGVITALALEKALLLVPILSVVGGFWAFLLLDYHLPNLARHLLRLIPFEAGRAFARDVLDHLRDRLQVRFLVLLGIHTALVWIGYCAMFYIMFNGVGGLGLATGQAVAVFAITSMGAALPSSPGALGVYEAAVVLALGWFGVAKEEALALAVTFHLIQMIPMMAGAAFILMGTDINPWTMLRNKSLAQDDTKDAHHGG